ncbi:MAG: universal stress protein [Pseudomonadota bacterium]
MFKTILCSYDGSDHAQRALATAAHLSNTLDARLHICHTPQRDIPPIVVGALIAPLAHPPSDAQMAEATRHLMADASARAKEMGGQQVVTHVGGTDPAKHALSLAKDINADLIVMGRRGLGTVGSLALGSVSQAISHGTRCACLTVV